MFAAKKADRNADDLRRSTRIDHRAGWMESCSIPNALHWKRISWNASAAGGLWKRSGLSSKRSVGTASESTRPVSFVVEFYPTSASFPSRNHHRAAGVITFGHCPIPSVQPSRWHYSWRSLSLRLFFLNQAASRSLSPPWKLTIASSRGNFLCAERITPMKSSNSSPARWAGTSTPWATILRPWVYGPWRASSGRLTVARFSSRFIRGKGGLFFATLLSDLK